MKSINHNFLFSVNAQLGSILEPKYDTSLVLVSVFLAIVSSYVAFLVSTRISISKNKNHQRWWLFTGSFSLSFGIWAMHFIGMLAYQIPLSINYDVKLTIISFIPAIISSYFVLRIAKKSLFTTKSLLIHSLFMSGGIGLMHYIGMFAMHVNAVMVYDIKLFILSLLIAFVMSWYSLKLKFKALQVISSNKIFNSGFIIPAIIMGVAISSMHYTGMAAMTMYSSPTSVTIPYSSLSTDTLVNIIAGLTAFLIVIVVISLEISRQLSLYLRINVSEKK